MEIRIYEFGGSWLWQMKHPDTDEVICQSATAFDAPAVAKEDCQQVLQIVRIRAGEFFTVEDNKE